MNFRLMAAAAASVLVLVGTAAADDSSSTNASSLRALGAKIHLRIGTAAIPSDAQMDLRAQGTE